ncbi:hypothetical protein K7B10_36755 [Streptomyces flavotricini]|uniref:Uncharacterized protein n=1 Tax=Streptomyces flavotricini TaxID=66888 RepID=A0ABS8EGF5_9ACTN|nr:hypothetical protein [Streptomyces flavotricini]MCC0100235.1 hypothetical protein [Streptomyces flavotricini]
MTFGAYYRHIACPFELVFTHAIKSFMLDGDGFRARNYYVWDAGEKARAFFTEGIVEKVTGIHGVPPEIGYLDIVGFVDRSGTRSSRSPSHEPAPSGPFSEHPGMPQNFPASRPTAPAAT